MIQRTITTIIQGSWRQGFLGNGHKALNVLENIPYENSDPFIVFMDDDMNLPGGPPVGGPHPHAGIETLTLVLKGDGKDLLTGSLEIMTAGKGIIHTEEISTETNVHILQVWLVLPLDKRWVQPFFQKILLEDVPKIITDLYEIRVYSGSSNGLVSPVKDFTPFSLIDYRMEKNAQIVQEIPGAYNGLIYMLDGSVTIAGKMLKTGQTGWINKTGTDEESQVTFDTKDETARFVLYAGQPHHIPVVQHGPFVAESAEDISKLYREYRHGEMPHLNSLPESQKTQYFKE
ncbi:pirin family protein [Chryseobacterium herbae]|uniref:Pirin family protein n=1 Tax=Chryseobacterium herbae TaxID=2976476 RepID=A0ABT2IUW7_9FLAO|nr:pirin-like C-terminal cupin domain-containing protein [Chryseobacterium sp. pc1-10]MCT2562597.1 pirin family protein [Chryseobacterium sp. pc1-10]